MSLGVEGRDLERHVRMMKRHFPGSELLYLIEGLEPWSRRNRALRNRQFAAAVRAEAPSRRTTHAREPVDEEIIEDALMGLQVRHKARIHHAAVGIETARWIATFTQHVSTAPYRRRRDGINDAAAAFGMDAGQGPVRGGPAGKGVCWDAAGSGQGLGFRGVWSRRRVWGRRGAGEGIGGGWAACASRGVGRRWGGGRDGGEDRWAGFE